MNRLRFLTPRERLVLSYLMDGVLVDEIAVLEYVTVATVRSQVRSILLKLGVSSQLAAVAMAYHACWPHDHDRAEAINTLRGIA